METLKAAIASVVCPTARRMTGHSVGLTNDAPPSSANDDPSSSSTNSHLLPSPFLRRTLYLYSLIIIRPIALVVALVFAASGGIVSVFFHVTGLSPPPIECPNDGPRTRPRPKRTSSSASSPSGSTEVRTSWLGSLGRRRGARTPLASSSSLLAPHSRIKAMTPHNLSNVEESDEEEEELDMESMTADQGSESDGPSEVDTVEDATSPPAISVSSSGGLGFFRRKPRRGVSEDSSEVTGSEDGKSTKRHGVKVLCPKSRRKGKGVASPALSITTSSDCYSTSTASSTSSAKRNPSPSRPILRASRSSEPLLFSEPDSYLVPHSTPSSSLSAPPSPTFLPFTTTSSGRRKFTFKNAFRTRDKSPLSSPPSSPPLSPRMMQQRSLSSLAIDLETEGEEGVVDASGKSGLSLGEFGVLKR